MGDEFDADAFAAIADGDEPDESTEAEPTATENHATVEGAPDESDVGSESTLRDMLMNDDPDISLDQVESPWNPEDGGTTRVYRGLMKAFDIDGMPAIGDIGIGVMEFAVELRDGLEPNDADGGEGETDELTDEEAGAIV